jgi:hypothetical protein
MINAIVFLNLLACGLVVGFVIVGSLFFEESGKFDPGAIYFAGVSVGSALVTTFLGQLLHAFFDLADCAINYKPKP